MAALIKSSSVANKSAFLLDPVAQPMEPEKAITDKKPPACQVEPAVEIAASVAAAPVTVDIQEKALAPETEAEAYARFMERHAESLRSLEEAARKEAYAAGYGEGERAGYEAGLAKGSKDGTERYEQAIAALELVASAGRDALAAGLEEQASLIGAIVFQAVCKIVGNAVQTPEGVQAIVSQALADAKRSEVVSLKVAPDDLRLLLEHAASLQPESDRLQSIGLEADERVELGGCIVQLKGGHIDARIETQFRAFAQSLKDAVLRGD